MQFVEHLHKSRHPVNQIFPQNFPLTLSGCSGAPVLLQPLAFQLFVGSHTVQTFYALCAKIVQISFSQL